MTINIAIDGPSAAGKSTVAKKIAKELNYIHLDTGAMYRCVAYKAMSSGFKLEQSEEKQICEMLKDTEIEMTSDERVFLDGKNVTKRIRANEISMGASMVSKLVDVRKELVKRQQEIARAKGYILDGRDIGTVVLKDAEVKIFMIADPESRAKRRYQENRKKGITSNYDKLVKEINDRDYQDLNRLNSPLLKADDAIELDTSNLTIEETCDAVLEIIKEKRK
jgi:cytidylate kinase